MKSYLVLVAGFACRLLTFAADPPKAPTVEDTWVGIYTSPEEIAGFSGKVLVIERSFDKTLRYRMTSYSDVVSSDTIDETEKRGEVLIDGDRLYIPTAYGYYHDGKPSLLADITRYTRLEINGRKVLMRDDALKAFRGENKLYDYGILIKVADLLEEGKKLEDAKHESIKILYSDPSKGWKDPFVNGPNIR